MAPPRPVVDKTTFARQRALARAIAAYVQRNPQAADSVDGVARWWLAGTALENAPPSDVQLALAALVRHGVFRSVELVDGTVIYSKGGGRRIKWRHGVG